ncbi:transcriptional regulatory protein [Tolypocladium capitatum]|uniref:Transcriptional regulatory protein n=1 Tax=Tolypocladium capitatum TaxID=45235 RepID=A0A2K3Q917_9HYPO|nr:transcriptional regulatory protein [Tolypocladium capitatum]
MRNTNNPADVRGGSSMKRRPSGSAGSSSRAAPKRAKLVKHDEKTSGGFDPQDLAHHLPAEIWHRVFTLVPPKTLGRLLTVNKLFRTYLDPSFPAEVKASFSPSSILSPMKPDAIWRASRRAFWPHMPGPLQGKSEVDMWRLCCTRACQFCKSPDRSDAGKTQHPWSRGPGAKGVSPVFPFFIVSCGKCLSDSIAKEVDVLLSPSTPSFLLAGLPMVFITPELHVIPPQALSGTWTLKTLVEKGFSSTQIKVINAEFEAVKALGYAAAEEWTKGLQARRKRSLSDASRWERWYLSGGVHDMRTSREGLQAPPVEDEAASLHLFRHTAGSLHIAEKRGDSHSPAVSPTGGNKGLARMRAEAIDVRSGSRPRPLGQQRLTEGEAAELKAKRKAEIERRALLLDPPMAHSVLVHAPSFQAAVQITTPLDDKAWEILKPRLLDHREAAGRREKASVANARACHASANASRPNNRVAQPRKEVTDKDWDEAQGPLRTKISEFADEVIRDAWNDGKKVSKKEASRFAVDVLLFVRARFYADVAEEAAAARAAGRVPTTDPPEGPWTQRLTLENMKWVFDMKIKRYTDRHRKELFFCNGCQGNRRPFGLESAVQHYAAKHTTALSVGNVVVHWRAEWPETSIFDPDPKQRRLQQPDGNANVPPVGPQPSYGYHDHNALPPFDCPPNGTPRQPYNHATWVPTASPTAGVAPPTGHAGPCPPQSPPHAPAYPLRPQWPHSTAPYQSGRSNTGYAQGPSVSSNGSASAPRQAERQADPAAPAASATIGQYTNKLNFMAEVAKEISAKITQVKGLPDAAKACAVVRHITTGFERQFSEATPLEMFVDSLSKNKDMAPARNLKDLRCKACVLGVENGSKPRTFPALVQHFVAKHTQRSGRGHLKDWRVDMIWPPDVERVPALRKGSRSHRESIALVADAAPQAFAVEPFGGPIANQQQHSRGRESPQEKSEASDGVNRRDSSSSDSYEPEYYPKDIPVKPEGPEPRDAPAAAPAANENARLHDPVALDIVDRPDFQPASVVYGRTDTSRQSLRGRDPSQRGGRRTPRTTQPDLGPEGVEVRRAAAAVALARQEDSGLEILDRLEFRLDSQRGAPARSEPAWRETHQASGPRECPPRDYASRNGYAVAHEHPADRYHELAPHTLARPEGYPHGWYDGRSPRLAHPSPAYRQGDLVAYRSYPDELPARPTQPAEAYELVEVRDPRGDYFIRRPIRRDLVAFCPREAPGVELYPRHAPANAHEREVRRPTAYKDYRQPPAHAPQRPPSAMDYEEYDPRYPASGSGSASAAPRDPRFQQYRQ